MDVRKKLSENEVKKRVKALDWTLNSKNTELSKVFRQRTFVSGLSFVAMIAVHAELINHHPDIELSKGKVKVKLTSHEVNGLTLGDFDLARRIDTMQKAKI
jgi:4a-hydroxytetrahydrobiopterin dehydratase